jgi:predicted ribosome quality control (RQC) complex YloA/Tae2 family protein
MVRNYFTLRAIAQELDEGLRGHIIAELFTQEKDTLAISFVGLRNTLTVSCRANQALLYLHPAYHRAKTNSADICRGCWKQTVRGVSIHPSDRIISLALHTGSTLHAQLYGPQANVILTDATGTVMDAFKNPRTLIGTPYALPPSLPLFNTGLLSSVVKEAPASQVGPLLKRLLPTYGPVLITEVLSRAGLPSHRTASQLSPGEAEELMAAIAALHAELEKPRPVIYTPARIRRSTTESVLTQTFSIVPLRHIHAAEIERFDTVQHAIYTFLASQDRATRLHQAKEQLLSPLRLLAEKTSRTVRAMEQELDDYDRAAQWKRYGSLLIAHLPDLRKGMETAHLLDGEETTTISLDPSLLPVDNARRYFEKAKQARLARRKSKERLRRAHGTLAQARQAIAALRTVDTMETLRAYMKQHAKELDDLGAGTKSGGRTELPFRIFTVDGGFEVFAGKSGANNDLLTMKHAKPRDLWFHARGASGSHVVLKIDSGRGEPSKKAKEQAAAIAAYYSKMRGAKLVPVAIAERKYVRKPKGAPPGTVVLEREKVIFARPALPSEGKE